MSAAPEQSTTDQTPEQADVPDPAAQSGEEGAVESQGQQQFLEDESTQEEVEHPTKLLRIAHSIRSMLDEVRTTDLDEAGRKRLAEIHNRSLAELREILSEDLSDELADIGLDIEGTPSGAELRLVQAQLAGWLEGLFRGIQASMAQQQRAMQQQLEQMSNQRQQQLQPGDQQPSSGQYL